MQKELLFIIERAYLYYFKMILVSVYLPFGTGLITDSK
jgi:hypothetical protein